MQVVTSAEIISIKEYSEDLREYILKPEKYRRFDAGTFLQLALEDVSASEYWPESRTFSMASAYNKTKTIKLIIRKVGKFTKRIFEETKVGSKLTIKYSFGDMLLPQFDTQCEVVCIAAGTGIAPFLSFMEELENENQLDRMKLLYTVRREEDFISYEEIKDKIHNDNLMLFSTDIKSEKAEYRLLNTNDIFTVTKEKERAHYYICGSPEFISFFKTELESNNIKNIHLDEWE